MAKLTIKGIYEDGKIELEEMPTGVKRARVRVTFLPESAADDKAERSAARLRAFDRMRVGIDFGGEKFNRDEIYEVRMAELDARRGQK